MLGLLIWQPVDFIAGSTLGGDYKTLAKRTFLVENSLTNLSCFLITAKVGHCFVNRVRKTLTIG